MKTYFIMYPDYDLIVAADCPKKAIHFWVSHYELKEDISWIESGNIEPHSPGESNNDYVAIFEVKTTGVSGPLGWFHDDVGGTCDAVAYFY